MRNKILEIFTIKGIPNSKLFKKDEMTITQEQVDQLESLFNSNLKEQREGELKFNIPKDKEDKRKLLIDLEEQVGVILREEKGKIIVTKYDITK